MDWLILLVAVIFSGVIMWIVYKLSRPDTAPLDDDELDMLAVLDDLEHSD